MSHWEGSARRKSIERAFIPSEFPDDIWDVLHPNSIRGDRNVRAWLYLFFLPFNISDYCLVPVLCFIFIECNMLVFSDWLVDFGWNQYVVCGYHFLIFVQVSKRNKRRDCEFPNQEQEVLITITITDNSIGPQVGYLIASSFIQIYRNLHLSMIPCY